MKSNRLISCIIAIVSSPLSASGIDASINATVQPITNLLSSFIFYEVEIFGASMPLIVLWLIGAAIFFTGYFNFLNLRGFKHAFQLLRGDYSRPDNEGELTHFQALSTAVSTHTVSTVNDCQHTINTLSTTISSFVRFMDWVRPRCDYRFRHN